MKRSGFARPVIERKRAVHVPIPPELRRNASMTPVMTSRTSIPKTEAHRNPALLEMARGRQCLIQLPHKCLNPSTETTVAAHSNWHEHGKAGARKADDEFSVAACFACHSWLDQGPGTEAEKRATFAAAHQRQIAQWERIAADPTEPARFRKAAQWALNHLMRK